MEAEEKPVKNERNEAIHGDDQVDGIHRRSLVTKKTSEVHSQAVQEIATAFKNGGFNNMA